MNPTRQRLIDGPDSDYLTRDEVARYLRMDPRTLKRLIARGEFPQALELSPGTLVWIWRDVVAYVLWAELKPRLRLFEGRTNRDMAGQSRTSGKKDG